MHLNNAVLWLCLLYGENNNKKYTRRIVRGFFPIFGIAYFSANILKILSVRQYLFTLFNFQTTLFLLIRHTRVDDKSVLNTICNRPQAVKDLSSVRLSYYPLYSVLCPSCYKLLTECIDSFDRLGLGERSSAICNVHQ